MSAVIRVIGVLGGTVNQREITPRSSSMFINYPFNKTLRADGQIATQLILTEK